MHLNETFGCTTWYPWLSLNSSYAGHVSLLHSCWAIILIANAMSFDIWMRTLGFVPLYECWFCYLVGYSWLFIVACRGWRSCWIYLSLYFFCQIYLSQLVHHTGSNCRAFLLICFHVCRLGFWHLMPHTSWKLEATLLYQSRFAFSPLVVVFCPCISDDACWSPLIKVLLHK